MIKDKNFRDFYAATKEEITLWLVQSKIIASKTFLGGTNITSCRYQVQYQGNALYLPCSST
jgi:hypothetical protein